MCTRKQPLGPTPLHPYLKTTAVPPSLPYFGWTAWTASTAQFSAVSAPDPTTGQQYFCLVLDVNGSPMGMRYDFGLNPVPIPGHPDTDAGPFLTLFEQSPLSAFYGWTYVIDPASGGHYFISRRQRSSDQRSVLDLPY